VPFVEAYGGVGDVEEGKGETEPVPSGIDEPKGAVTGASVDSAVTLEFVDGKGATKDEVGELGSLEPVPFSEDVCSGATAEVSFGTAELDAFANDVDEDGTVPFGPLEPVTSGALVEGPADPV
jgi:hypothetical protein